jgi:hypothetical protein
MTSLRLISRTVKNSPRPRMIRALMAALLLTFAIGAANSEAASAVRTDNTKLNERLTYARAFEAVVWATPFLNTLQMRSELERLGVNGGKLAFVGSPPTSKLILPTFNNVTVYVFG